MACLVSVLTLFESAYATLPLICLALAFSAIGAGNDVFGLLSWKISRSLGELSYGIFMLHGILLFVVFRFAIGFKLSSNLTQLQFWSVVIACTPVLVLLAFTALDWLENPMLGRTDALSAWFSAQLTSWGRQKFIR